MQDYFDQASCFVSQPGASGQFTILAMPSRLTIAAFATLCRQLDIGGRYQQRLEALLLPADAVANAALAHKITTSQQERFRVAILLARMKGDIGENAQTVLLHLLRGIHRPFWFRGSVQLQTDMMAAVRPGIVLLLPIWSVPAKSNRLLPMSPMIRNTRL